MCFKLGSQESLEPPTTSRDEETSVPKETRDVDRGGRDVLGPIGKEIQRPKRETAPRPATWKAQAGVALGSTGDAAAGIVEVDLGAPVSSSTQKREREMCATVRSGSTPSQNGGGDGDEGRHRPDRDGVAPRVPRNGTRASEDDVGQVKDGLRCAPPSL